MSKLQIAIFNVGAGQSILLYPTQQPDHTMLVDCGGEENGFSPVEFLVSGNILPKNIYGNPKLGGLAITNYDHDHFSWLPDLWKKIQIWTIRFPQNITTQELKSCKEEETDALRHVCHIKDTYIHPVPNFAPMYQVYSEHLGRHELDGDVNTNHLSQIIFVDFGGSRICITGDLERPAWEKLLQRQSIRDRLKYANVFIASHHGRENGYHEGVFAHCKPELIVISDKDIMHDTQGGMAQKYAAHVVGNGVNFNGNGSLRKVLTTRSDGHILIDFGLNGVRSYNVLRV